MIRTVLIFVYITLVLLVSGLARAADFAQIDNVAFDPRSSMLHVTGSFTNSCQSSPKPVVASQVQEETQTVAYIGVQVEESVGKMCMQIISGKYDLLIDIRSLGLPAQQDLVLKFKNLAEGISLDPIATRIDRPARRTQPAATTVSGQLVELSAIGMPQEPVYVVVGENGSATQVQSVIDLSNYVNNNVRVGGIVLSNFVSPGVDKVDLGFEDSTSQKLEKVFAMEISLAPLQ